MSAFSIKSLKINHLKNLLELFHGLALCKAQDFLMSKWVVVSRIPDSTERTFEAAYNNGEIIRKHLMCPNWLLLAQKEL